MNTSTDIARIIAAFSVISHREEATAYLEKMQGTGNGGRISLLDRILQTQGRVFPNREQMEDYARQVELETEDYRGALELREWIIQLLRPHLSALILADTPSPDPLHRQVRLSELQATRENLENLMKGTGNLEFFRFFLKLWEEIGIVLQRYVRNASLKQAGPNQSDAQFLIKECAPWLDPEEIRSLLLPVLAWDHHTELAVRLLKEHRERAIEAGKGPQLRKDVLKHVLSPIRNQKFEAP